MRRNRRAKRWPLVLAIVIGVGVVIWLRPWAESSDNPQADAPDQDAPGEVVVDPSETPAAPADISSANDAPVTPPAVVAGTPVAPPAPQPPATVPAISDSAAAAAYQRGMELLRSDKFIEARTELNRAYYAGSLPAETQDALHRTLSDLADMTLIGPSSSVFEGDPYAFRYECQPGDLLAKVERKLELHVPWQLILRVNGLRRAEDIQAGRVYKMVRGPFHAVVDKDAFTMDIYLQREGLERVFVRRVRVGTGINGSTPAGQWRVRLGGKEVHPTWYPPPNSPLRGAVPYGDPNYAFGEKGLWISLEGLDEKTSLLSDYGLHSTNDPSSIGSPGSLGCIRLGDDDIELAFTLLYEHWSTVEVR